jgi:uncharacterized membrane protein YfcA
MVQYLWLVPVGVLVGTFGTLIGAGGGFILAPVLLLMYPHESPEILTSISLAVVFFNALSGSVAYARMRRIDYRSGVLFAVATVPGAVVGALTTGYIPRRTFDLLFGMCMIVAALFLLIRQGRASSMQQSGSHHFQRTLIDTEGTRYTFSYNPVLGVGLSVAVGYLSSLLGIGGGIIHVPMMARVLHFPVHIATATSHFTLAVMALAGTLVHIATGAFHHGVRRTIALALGVLVGAQLGARLSHAVHGVWILRSLAMALGAVGVRIVLYALIHP